MFCYNPQLQLIHVCLIPVLIVGSVGVVTVYLMAVTVCRPSVVHFVTAIWMRQQGHAYVDEYTQMVWISNMNIK